MWGNVNPDFLGGSVRAIFLGTILQNYQKFSLPNTLSFINLSTKTLREIHKTRCVQLLLEILLTNNTRKFLNAYLYGIGLTQQTWIDQTAHSQERIVFRTGSGSSEPLE